MTLAWAQRQEALLSDCIVPLGVFMHMVDRLSDFAVPYQHALETEAGQRNVYLYLVGLLSHLDRKNAGRIAALVDVERLVRQDFIGTVLWDHRLLIQVLVGQVVDQLDEADGIIAFDPSSFPKRSTHSVVSSASGVATMARSTTARSASSWDTSVAKTMPCSTSACTCPRSGHGTSNNARNAMCQRRRGIKPEQ